MTKTGVPGPSKAPHLWALDIAREFQDGVLLLVVTGRLGAVSSAALVETLAQELRAGHRRILLDLARVDYMSSAGLLALQNIAGRLHESGATLVLCSLSGPVRLVLDLAGLLSSFAIETSREAGIARFQR
jgi:stage II sporulation protein AA (anti-sigma F factor antagonist)